MANVWRKDDNVKEQPKRNIVDLSFQNNLTTQFGKLVPVICKEFIPGDSFSIQPTFSLKFQPMVFPIQTRMRAHLHFFKVRNRNLWKDWEDFIAKNKENLDPPYLDTSVTKPTTGSLLDYLGVPTTIVGNYGNYELSDSIPHVAVNLSKYYRTSISLFSESVTNVLAFYNERSVAFDRDSSAGNADLNVHFISRYDLTDVDLSEISFIRTRVGSYAVPLPGGYTYINDWLNMLFLETDSDLPYQSPTPIEDNVPWRFFSLVFSNDSELTTSSEVFCVPCSSLGDNGLLTFDLSDISLSSYRYCYLSFNSPIALYYVSADGETIWKQRPLFSEPTYSSLDLYRSVGEVTDIDDSTSPYWRSGATVDLRERIKLSALPCRAYEQIYNSFYRNAENNPYILNGVPEYNKYMPTDEGGVDANLYDFYYRNWEDDFLTTALQQPQAGIAPLVGLTGTAGTATVTLADEDGNTSEATASYDEEGNVTSVAFANNTSLTEALADAVQYGISINDLRNVNAFQRWLEAKARGGYKYRDVIETMFGITVRYDTLDMPEFIGGTSIDIMVNQISQTVPTESSPLGDYAGQAAGIGTGQTINEYFDEHGFVIGILSVVPVPNYSQLLPKHFIKRDAFDYYFPQFGHIGMQPIKYDEVCPVQAYQDSTEQSNTLDETFGYQRAWYDYLASTDEVHGEFRTNLRNFVMNRLFDVKPELVKEFLTVDPSQLNDVFAIQDDSYDKILGQIYFDIKAKRPIPLYGIPKLE